MAWNNTIAFVSGSYPNQVLPSTDFNKLYDNAVILDGGGFSRVYSSNTTTPPTAITQATAGTWATLSSVTINYAYLASVLIFSGVVVANAVVANRVNFAVFKNGTMYGGIVGKYNASATNPLIITLTKYFPKNVLAVNDVIDVRWTVELATPNVTYTMPSGYKHDQWQF